MTAANEPDTAPEALHLITDFTSDVLVNMLKQRVRTGTRVSAAAYGQVAQSVRGAERDENIDASTTVLVWTRPESVIAGFAEAMRMAPCDHGQVIAEVEAWAHMLGRLAEQSRFVIVPTWEIRAGRRLFGPLDLKNGVGVRNLLMRMNLVLCDLMDSVPNLYVIDPSHWFATSGSDAYSPKSEFISKVPYARNVLESAADELTGLLPALAGKARKLIVVDLDNTLWGGVVGDDGYERLDLGGHGYRGEAFLAFQKSLANLSNRGVQLAIASKNSEQVALEAIDKHPEMVLRRQAFAAWRINWRDKAANICELVDELRLALDSVVFIDDNPVERDRVAQSLPDVFVPEWPADPALYASRLESLTCFDLPSLTDEDFARTEMYHDERERTRSRGEFDEGSVQEWLATLETRVAFELLNPVNLARTAQLLNKTNQMNMRTRRMSEAELLDWVDQPGNTILTATVEDRFGKAGLTGIVGVQVQDGTAEITDLVLSCRVMGRGVELALLHAASRLAIDRGASKLAATYVATERNAPCLDVLEQSDLEQVGDGMFMWSGEVPMAAPSTLTIDYPEA